jgi:hypothetical protein
MSVLLRISNNITPPYYCLIPHIIIFKCRIYTVYVVLSGVVVIVLAIRPKVRGFKPGRERWIFMGRKISSTASFAGEVKPSAHIVRFYST